MQEIINYIEDHLNEKIDLDSIADWKNRSERNGLSFKPEHVSLKTVHFSTHN